jgi:general secretion pathway protein N
MKKRYIFALCAATSVAVLLIKAPAAWLSPVLSHYTQGAVSFEHAWGSVWHGTAQVRIQRSSKEAIVLPQAVSWDLHLIHPDSGIALKATVKSTALLAPLDLNLNRNQGGQAVLTISAGQYHLPVNNLNSLGAPFNTLQLAGDVSLAWAAITQPLSAKTPPAVPLTMNVNRLRSVITGDTVLGDYRLSASPSAVNTAAALRWDLTLSTPSDTNPASLLLNGSGQLTLPNKLSFELHAKPSDAAAKQRLGALLNFLGRKEGEEHVLRLR